MQTETKIVHGTVAWFDMVGSLMVEAAVASGLPTQMQISISERYTDGLEVSAGLLQGLRLDLGNGQASCQVGVGADEHADIIMEITTAAARQLNALYAADPAYAAALQAHLDTGEMRISGDPSAVMDWLALLHDPIVDRTA